MYVFRTEKTFNYGSKNTQDQHIGDLSFETPLFLTVN